MSNIKVAIMMGSKSDLDVMQESSKIVFVVGKSRSFQWEVRMAITNNYLSKCLFVLPPYYYLEHSIVETLPELAACFGMETLEEEIVHLRNALVIMGWGQPPKFVFIRGQDEPSARGYAEAIRFCAVLADLR